MAREISNSDDIIDSRDVIARIEELEDELAGIVDAMEDSDYDGDGTESAEWETKNGDELTALNALADECEGYGDWKYGEALIRDSYFREYAEQMADDIGAIDRNAHWPINCIDWDKAAEQLKADYMAVDFDGVTYWMRA